jgi:hypothetical protein
MRFSARRIQASATSTLEVQRDNLRAYLGNYLPKILAHAEKKYGRGRPRREAEAVAIDAVNAAVVRVLTTTSKIRARPEALGAFLAAAMDNARRDEARRERHGGRVHAAMVAGEVMYEHETRPARPTRPLPTLDDQDVEVTGPTVNVRLPGDEIRPLGFVLPFEGPQVHILPADKELGPGLELDTLVKRAGVSKADLKLLLKVHGEDLSIREAAREAGLPPETARRRVQSAFRALQRTANKVGQSGRLVRPTITRRERVKTKKGRRRQQSEPARKKPINMKMLRGHVLSCRVGCPGGHTGEVPGMKLIEYLSESDLATGEIALDLIKPMLVSGKMDGYIRADKLVEKQLVFTDAIYAFMEMAWELGVRFKDEKGEPTEAGLSVADDLIPQLPDIWERYRKGEVTGVDVTMPNGEKIALHFLERAKDVVEGKAPTGALRRYADQAMPQQAEAAK